MEAIAHSATTACIKCGTSILPGERVCRECWELQLPPTADPKLVRSVQIVGAIAGGCFAPIVALYGQAVDQRLPYHPNHGVAFPPALGFAIAFHLAFIACTAWIFAKAPRSMRVAGWFLLLAEVPLLVVIYGVIIAPSMK